MSVNDFVLYFQLIVSIKNQLEDVQIGFDINLSISEMILYSVLEEDSKLYV